MIICMSMIICQRFKFYRPSFGQTQRGLGWRMRVQGTHKVVHSCSFLVVMLHIATYPQIMISKEKLKSPTSEGYGGYAGRLDPRSIRMIWSLEVLWVWSSRFDPFPSWSKLSRSQPPLLIFVTQQPWWNLHFILGPAPWHPLAMTLGCPPSIGIYGSPLLNSSALDMVLFVFGVEFRKPLRFQGCGKSLRYLGPPYTYQPTWGDWNLLKWFWAVFSSSRGICRHLWIGWPPTADLFTYPSPWLIYLSFNNGVTIFHASCPLDHLMSIPLNLPQAKPYGIWVLPNAINPICLQGWFQSRPFLGSHWGWLIPCLRALHPVHELHVCREIYVSYHPQNHQHPSTNEFNYHFRGS